MGTKTTPSRPDAGLVLNWHADAPSAGLQAVGERSFQEGSFGALGKLGQGRPAKALQRTLGAENTDSAEPLTLVAMRGRSEERRVGKECLRLV